MGTQFMKAVRCTFGCLLSLPVLGGYMVGCFLMAALLIALTCEQTYKVQPGCFRADTDSCLVELEVLEVRAEGKVQVPGLGEIPEAAVIVQSGGSYYTAPHVYCGCWELRLPPEIIAGRLSGGLGMHSGGDSSYWYTVSPAWPYDSIPIRLLGRQQGKLIHVLEVADSSGGYAEHMVCGAGFKLLAGAVCVVVAVCMAGVWWLFRPYSRRGFVPVMLFCLCLIVLAAGVLVWQRWAVHSELAAGWAAPLAVVVALLGCTGVAVWLLSGAGKRKSIQDDEEHK